MLSQTARYSLQVLGYLALHASEWTGVETLARSTNIPASYLSKILNQLRKNRVVKSQKGWGGGFLLEPSALEKPISDVLIVLEGEEKIKPCECVFGLPVCSHTTPCPLHNHWQQSREAYIRMLKDTKIKDLADIHQRSKTC